MIIVPVGPHHVTNFSEESHASPFYWACSVGPQADRTLRVEQHEVRSTPAIAWFFEGGEMRFEGTNGDDVLKNIRGFDPPGAPVLTTVWYDMDAPGGGLVSIDTGVAPALVTAITITTKEGNDTVDLAAGFFDIPMLERLTILTGSG